MAESNSEKYVKTSDLKEFRQVLNEVSELVPISSSNEEEQNSKSALLKEASTSLSQCAPDAATKLNELGQQLSIYYGNTIASPTDDLEQEDNQSPSSTIPKSESKENLRPKPKRHIMISYNQSSRPICKRIYDGLVSRNYKVWMDLTDMFDDVLVGMARAIENSYIVLLCINQKYYESEYCRLEAQYAAERRVKFIPCLMEKDFQAESWLGIIKGSNVHIDFSSTDEFDKSFKNLIRQIDFIEKKLDLYPRITPGPEKVRNPLENLKNPSDSDNERRGQRFDEIIRQYRDSIEKDDHPLSNLKRSELLEIIGKLRQELFDERNPNFSDGENSSDEEEEKAKGNDRLLQDLVVRSMQQNEQLIQLVDRLTAQNAQRRFGQNVDIDGIIKLVIAILLLWTLNILYQKSSIS